MRCDGADPGALAQAARLLADGGLVAFPTETVYGLGARADDDRAVRAIFAAKGRPSDHPLIVHVAERTGVAAFAADWPPVADRLAAAFWPGPLTLIVQRRPGRATAAAGGHPTIGLRCPSHPVAHALLQAAARQGVPGVAAPSANRFGRISPTRADHVVAEFGDGILVLDGGACEMGIESAIVDCSSAHPVLLRPGSLTRMQIEGAAGEPLRARGVRDARAPGTLESHYAPSARLRLWSPEALQGAFGTLDAKAALGVAVYSRTPPVGGTAGSAPAASVRTMPQSASAVGRELFAVLRDLDALGVTEIWVEQPPDLPEWEGVRDRLHRAAAG